jgi:hypothetical protein
MTIGGITTPLIAGEVNPSIMLFSLTGYDIQILVRLIYGSYPMHARKGAMVAPRYIHSPACVLLGLPSQYYTAILLMALLRLV